MKKKTKINFTLQKKVTPTSKIPGFGIREMFEDEEKIPRDLPELEKE